MVNFAVFTVVFAAFAALALQAALQAAV